MKIYFVHSSETENFWPALNSPSQASAGYQYRKNISTCLRRWKVLDGGENFVLTHAFALFFISLNCVFYASLLPMSAKNWASLLVGNFFLISFGIIFSRLLRWTKEEKKRKEWKLEQSRRSHFVCSPQESLSKHFSSEKKAFPSLLHQIVSTPLNWINSRAEEIHFVNLLLSEKKRSEEAQAKRQSGSETADEWWKQCCKPCRPSEMALNETLRNSSLCHNLL